MSGSERRCATCARPILEVGMDGRRTRKDTRYCSKLCREMGEKARQAARWRENRERLLEQRRESYARSDKTAHAERMRDYMRDYRAKQKEK